MGRNPKSRAMVQIIEIRAMVQVIESCALSPYPLRLDTLYWSPVCNTALHYIDQSQSFRSLPLTVGYVVCLVVNIYTLQYMTTNSSCAVCFTYIILFWCYRSWTNSQLLSQLTFTSNQHWVNALCYQCKICTASPHLALGFIYHHGNYVNSHKYSKSGRDKQSRNFIQFILFHQRKS